MYPIRALIRAIRVAGQAFLTFGHRGLGVALALSGPFCHCATAVKELDSEGVARCAQPPIRIYMALPYNYYKKGYISSILRACMH